MISGRDSGTFTAKCVSLTRIFPNAATATAGIKPLVTEVTEARQEVTENTTGKERPLLRSVASLFPP